MSRALWDECLIEHDGVAGMEGWHEYFACVRAKDVGVDGAADAQCGNHNSRMPVATGCVRKETPTTQRKTAKAGHIGFGTQFVDQYKTFG